MVSLLRKRKVQLQRHDPQDGGGGIPSPPLVPSLGAPKARLPAKFLRQPEPSSGHWAIWVGSWGGRGSDWPPRRPSWKKKAPKGRRRSRGREKRSGIASEPHRNGSGAGRQKSQQACVGGGCKGGLGWIFLVCGVGEGGISLLKGFFQRSIFRAGVCRKAGRTTGGVCMAPAMPV